MGEPEQNEPFSLEMLGPGEGAACAEFGGASTPRVPERKDYVAAVSRRWSGWALQDAVERWDLLRSRAEELDAWIRHFRRDCWFKVGDKCHNRDGTIAGMLWLASKSSPTLGWLMDFEDHFQSFFLARGAQQYVELVLGMYEQKK